MLVSHFVSSCYLLPVTHNICKVLYSAGGKNIRSVPLKHLRWVSNEIPALFLIVSWFGEVCYHMTYSKACHTV